MTDDTERDLELIVEALRSDTYRIGHLFDLSDAVMRLKERLTEIGRLNHEAQRMTAKVDHVTEERDAALAKYAAALEIVRAVAAMPAPHIRLADVQGQARDLLASE